MNQNEEPKESSAVSSLSSQVKDANARVIESPVPVQLSPRLAWMRKHGIETKPRLYSAIGGWCATSKSKSFYQNGIGASEEEALTKWAVNNGVKLWNEEGAR